MSAEARVSVSVRYDRHEVTLREGQAVQHSPGIDVSVEFDPGHGSGAIVALHRALQEVADKIRELEP